MSSTEKTRDFFGQPEKYLGARAHVEFRSAKVVELVGAEKAESVLDIGCGDGTVGLAVAGAEADLLLVDTSKPMLELALHRAADRQVRSLNKDLMELGPEQATELVLCLGVLPHVESIDDALAKIASLVKPGGRAVVQLTDADSWVGRVLRRFHHSRSTRELRETSASRVVHTMEERGLHLEASRRYLPLLPGLGRLPAMVSAAFLRLSWRLALPRWMAGGCFLVFRRSDTGEPLAEEKRPHILSVGPHLGRHPGWVTTQGEILVDLFRSESYPVRETSNVRRAIPRAADMALRLVSWRRWADVAITSVFSGRAFLLADLVTWWMGRLGIPQVQVLRGGGLPELIRRRPRRVRRVLSRADAVVAPSAWLADEAAALGIEAIVIPNVLDLSRYEYRHRAELGTPLRLLWMRTFHEIYRPLMAIETLGRLRDAGVDGRLTMAGQERDADLVEACRRRARDLGLVERVRFVGFLDMEEKRRAFSQHDVFLNTNVVDNTPVTVLEAMASGLPVVATAVGGVPHLLRHGEAGVLVAADDADAMAAALRGLLSDPAEADRLSAAGREVAEACDWPAVHRRWRELFGRL